MKKVKLCALLLPLMVLTACSTPVKETAPAGLETSESFIEILAPPSADETVPSPPVEAEATGVATSGSYGADLAALGMVPDDITSYAEFMTKHLCESDLTDSLMGFPADVRQWGKPGGESTGYGPDIVRLTVAYYCPERTDAAETELESNGYTS